MLAQHSFEAFDTAVRVALCCSTEQQFNQAQLTLINVQDACCRYEQLFSCTLNNSDVARINCAGGNAVAVHPDTADLISQALHYCKNGMGIFDITAGGLTSLWNYKRSRIPSDEQRQEALKHIDWQKVHVWQSEQQWFVQMEDPLAHIDLGGIAKGWIADRLAESLLNTGFEDFLVNLGGNIIVHGENEQHNAWRIGVTDPFSETNTPIAVLHIDNGSVVTSGTYMRCFTVNNQHYHHIIDPKTAFPVKSDAVGATLVCAKSLDAEGYSTTALALGVKAGLAFCKTIPEIENAFFIDSSGNLHVLYGSN